MHVHYPLWRQLMDKMAWNNINWAIGEFNEDEQDNPLGIYASKMEGSFNVLVTSPDGSIAEQIHYQGLLTWREGFRACKGLTEAKEDKPAKVSSTLYDIVKNLNKDYLEKIEAENNSATHLSRLS